MNKGECDEQMSQENKGILAKIDNLDSRVLYAILIIVIGYTLFRPIGLPMPIDKLTRDAYNAVEALPEGSIILFPFDAGAREIPNTAPPAISLLNHCFSKKLKVVLFSMASTESSVNFLTGVLPSVNLHDAEYGVDWVFLGWAAGGGEVVAAAVALDIHAVYPLDYYGDPIDSLPLMQEVHSVDDIDFLISSSGALSLLRQFNSPYGTPMIAGASGLKTAEYLPFYNPLQLKGIVMGMGGAAQYERLLVNDGHEKNLGIGTQTMDSMSGAYLVVIFSMLVSNITSIIRKLGGR